VRFADCRPYVFLRHDREVAVDGTSNRLDSLIDRLMYRFAYRHSTAASAAETAVVNHSVKVSGTKRSQVVGIRWYRLGNLTGGTPTVLQQATYSPDSTSRWMGSIAMDKAGNIALGYSASSSSKYPSVYYTGPLASDPLGALQSEGTTQDRKWFPDGQRAPMGRLQCRVGRPQQ
jgi:hypothetical protein